MTSGQGRPPAAAPEKWLTSGPGPALGGGAQHQSGDVVALGEQLADRLDPARPGGR